MTMDDVTAITLDLKKFMEVWVVTKAIHTVFMAWTKIHLLAIRGGFEELLRVSNKL